MRLIHTLFIKKFFYVSVSSILIFLLISCDLSQSQMQEVPSTQNAASSSQSSTAYIHQIRDQLVDSGISHLSAGYSITHEAIIKYLQKNTDYVIGYDLDRGGTYAFVGVCDADCTSIKLELYDAQNNLIDSDLGYKVRIAINVRRSERFKLRITIPQCSTSGCWYGIMTFGK